MKPRSMGSFGVEYTLINNVKIKPVAWYQHTDSGPACVFTHMSGNMKRANICVEVAMSWLRCVSVSSSGGGTVQFVKLFVNVAISVGN